MGCKKLGEPNIVWRSPSGDTLITVIEYYSFIEVGVSGSDCHLLVYELTSTQGEVFLYIWHPSGSLIQATAGGDLNVHQTVFESDSHYLSTVRLFKAEASIDSCPRTLSNSEFYSRKTLRGSKGNMLCMVSDDLVDGRQACKLCSDYMSDIEHQLLHFKKKTFAQLPKIRLAEKLPTVLVFLPYTMFPADRVSSLQQSAPFHCLLKYCGRVLNKNLDSNIANWPCSSFLITLLFTLMVSLSAVELIGQHEGLDHLKDVNAAVGVGCGLYAAMVFSGAISLRKVIEVIEIHADSLERALPANEIGQNLKAALDTISLGEPRVPFLNEKGEHLEDKEIIKEHLISPLFSTITPRDLQRHLYQIGVCHILNMPCTL